MTDKKEVVKILIEKGKEFLDSPKEFGEI